MTIGRRALVSGRVQGVFFRATCREVAEENGVSGSAANLPDGRVEVLLEGEAEAVEKVLDWCRRGTPYSRVDAVEVSEEEPSGMGGFRIL